MCFIHAQNKVLIGSEKHWLPNKSMTMQRSWKKKREKKDVTALKSAMWIRKMSAHEHMSSDAKKGQQKNEKERKKVSVVAELTEKIHFKYSVAIQTSHFMYSCRVPLTKTFVTHWSFVSNSIFFFSAELAWELIKSDAFSKWHIILHQWLANRDKVITKCHEIERQREGKKTSSTAKYLSLHTWFPYWSYFYYDSNAYRR